MIDARIAEQVVAALRADVAAIGPAALQAMDSPECHAAVAVFGDACIALDAKGKAWNGTAPTTQALIDALHDYLRAFDTIVQEARRICLCDRSSRHQGTTVVSHISAC